MEHAKGQLPLSPILLEELGQQPLADMWLLRAAGF